MVDLLNDTISDASYSQFFFNDQNDRRHNDIVLAMLEVLGSKNNLLPRALNADIVNTVGGGKYEMKVSMSKASYKLTE